MQKNWDLIREILIRLEAAETPNTVLSAKSITGYEEQEVAYNMRLLHNAGFIKASILESSAGDGLIDAALARHLTNSGHELLDTIRADTVWEKVKEKFASKGVEMTFDLVMTVGKKVAEVVLLS